MEQVVRCSFCSERKSMMKRCSRCHKAFYCSRECQMKDWSNHKTRCSTRSRHCCPSARQGKDIWKTSECNGHLRQDASRTIHVSTMSSSVEEKPAYIDFQKAFDDVAKKCNISSQDEPSQNIEQETNDKRPPIQTYLCNNKVMTDVPVLDPEQPVVTIMVKANKQKHVINLNKTWSNAQILKIIAHRTQIALNNLKLIHKGKVMTDDCLPNVISNKAVFQAIGEQIEDEDGLDSNDIEVLMRQLSVGRNEAVKALRREGDVLSAILLIANK